VGQRAGDGRRTGAPRIRGIVARAALERGPAVRDELDRLASLPLVVGVRRNVQGEPAGFADDPAFVAGVRACADYGFSFDLCVTHDQLDEALRLAHACPEVRVVLDHAGKPPIRAGALDPWRAQLRALAALPNTWCKLSGLATEADRHDGRRRSWPPGRRTCSSASGRRARCGGATGRC
jgi:L-fuconolactonase